jgi:hypothetical protein
MGETLHIFRKDLRFLWPQIAIAVLLTAAAAWSRSVDPARFSDGRSAGSVPEAATFFMVLSWWYLAASAVHKEHLVGDRQFWVTRPYHWKHLAAAKALLIVACVNLPFLFYDLAILYSHGLTPVVRALMVRQVAMTVFVILPVAAIAAVTRDTAHMVLTMVAFFILFVFSVNSHNGASFSENETWARIIIGFAILSAGGLATLVWQFSRRTTALARGILTIAGILYLLTFLTPRISGSVGASVFRHENTAIRPVHLCYDSIQSPDQCLAPDGEGIPGWFAIRIDGIPAGMHAEPQTLHVSIDDMHGNIWQSQSIPQISGAPDRVGWVWGWLKSDRGLTRRIDVQVGDQVMERFRRGPVRIDVGLNLAVYRDGQPYTVPADGHRHIVPGFGICSLDRLPGISSQLLCEAAEYPGETLRVNQSATILASGFRELGASPIIETNVRLPDDSPVVLSTDTGVSYTHRNLELYNVRFEIMPQGREFHPLVPNQ